jgi:hypothetical protein
MFHGFSARVMAATHRLGIHGLNLPTVPEDDGSILLFFSQLAEELDGASAKVLDLIDAECRELLGLAGAAGARGGCRDLLQHLASLPRPQLGRDTAEAATPAIQNY